MKLSVKKELIYPTLSFLFVAAMAAFGYNKRQSDLNDQYLKGIHKGEKRGYAKGLYDGAIVLKPENMTIEMKVEITNNFISASIDTPKITIEILERLKIKD